MLMMKLPEWQAAIAEMADAAKDDDYVKDSIISMLANAGLIEQPEKWQRPAAAPLAIGAAELSIFDNWKGSRGPKKGKPWRWGISLKVWAKGEKVDWKKPSASVLATIFDAKGIKERAVDLKRKSLLEPISEAYAATVVDEIAPVMVEAGLLGGMLYTKKGGTYYHDHQMILIDKADLEARDPKSVILFLDAETRLDLHGFSNRDASGKRLTGNCIAQCRYIDPDDADLSKRLGGWSTQNLY